MSIRDELKSILQSQGLKEGRNVASRSIVAIGVSWSDKDPELVARVMAACRICQELKGTELRAIARSTSNVEGHDMSVAVHKITEGNILGLREVARVTHRANDGTCSVGIALRWTLDQELLALKALENVPENLEDLGTEISQIAHLERMSGPHVWFGKDGVVRFLGIGVAKISGESPRSLLMARRVAKIKAERNLSEHFVQYDPYGEFGALYRETLSLNQATLVAPSDFSTKKELDVSRLMRKRSVVSSSKSGVGQILSLPLEDDGMRYIVSVCGLIRIRN